MVKMPFCPFLPFLGPFFDFLSGPERSILGVGTRFWWSKMPKSNFVSFGSPIGVIICFRGVFVGFALIFRIFRPF